MSRQSKIGFWAAVLMNINIIVGAGILAMTQSMAATAGAASFLAWPMIGLLVFPVVWCIAQASRVFPGEGGIYNYCAKGINPTAGFVAQWAYLLGYMGTATTLTLVLKDALVHKAGLTIVGEYSMLFNTAVIVVFTLLNMLDVSKISKIQSGLTLLKLLPLVVAIGLLPFFFSVNVSYAPVDFGLIAMTLPSAIFALWGFEACVSISHLLKDGAQSVGRVVLMAFALVIVLYTLFHFSLIHIMGAKQLATHGAALFPQFLGFDANIVNALGLGILGAIIISYMNSIFGVTLGNMSNLYTLAKNKLITCSSALTTTNKQARPVTAGIAVAVVGWAMLYFIDKLSISVAITNVGVSTAFVLTLVALFLHFWKKRNMLQLAVTLLGFASCAMIIYYSWMDISPDATERLLYASPLAVGLVIGLVMNSVATCKKKTK